MDDEEEAFDNTGEAYRRDVESLYWDQDDDEDNEETDE